MSIATQEKESILSLIKYFSPHWQIVDVGSNKLAWSEVLMEHRDSSTEAGKYTIHSIEPNDKLRAYQQVKHDYNDNISYYPHVAYNKSGQEIDFWYWENRNNGLSSILNNHRWEDELGEFRLHKKVRSITIDDITHFLDHVDIIKIDVEGAEKIVLEGCKQLLIEKKVKFIQIEYSEHYRIIDAKFTDIINYAEQFGYLTWEWRGDRFYQINKESFIEDYRLENFILTYKNISKRSRDYINFNYTQLWNNEFKKNTEFLKGKVNFALEIGSFEGLTANYICDELLNKTEGIGSRMICVDPLIDGVYLEGHKDNYIFQGQYERFLNNTKDQPIELIRKTSDEAFAQDLDKYRFDFIYIDGDHRRNSVYHDGVNAFRVLRKGGYILFDDYGQSEETKEGVDAFIKKGMDDGKIEVVSIDYQVLIKRIR